MFEFLGRKKKVVQGPDLYPKNQPQPFFTHDPNPDGYREGLPITADEASNRFMGAGTEAADLAAIEAAEDAKLKTPSQGGQEVVGMRKDKAFDVAERKIDGGVPERNERSWKTHRDTPYRPEAPQ